MSQIFSLEVLKYLEKQPLNMSYEEMLTKGDLILLDLSTKSSWMIGQKTGTKEYGLVVRDLSVPEYRVILISHSFDTIRALPLKLEQFDFLTLENYEKVMLANGWGFATHIQENEDNG